ncbi:MAG: tyrosine-type recombinase/integrase [Solirubrobacterales bacterium]
MRGHIRKRGQKWTVRYDEPGEDGKRRQRRKGGFATKREAQTFLNEQLQRLGDGSYSQPSKQLLGEYLRCEWLPAVEGTLRPLSVVQYEQTIRLRIVPRLGGVRLQALSGGHLNSLYGELEQAGLSVSTRRLTHAVLHRALRDAVRWGKLVRNPADMADPPSRGRSRASAWTAGELRRFLAHVADDRLYALWRLAATTGMRRGELAAVTWRTLDLDAARLSVERQLIPTRGGVSFGPPKSSRSRRTIALDPETVDVLRSHKETQLLERDFAGESYDDQDLVFADALGGTVHPQRLTQWFAQHRKAAGSPVGTLHTLRHTAATLALTDGVPVHIVAARLGDDPKTVLSTYAHLLPQSDELAAERVAALIR